MKILFATGNTGKLREMARLLGSAAAVAGPPAGFVAVDESGETYRENAVLKARALASPTGAPVLGEDSGLEVDALQGAPGLHSARWGASDAARIERLLAELRDVPRGKRTARFRCVLALVLPDGLEIVTEGVVEGAIGAAPVGSGGFGYDPVFVVADAGRTFAAMSDAEKDRLSHRGVAARALRERLVRLGLVP